MSAKTLNQQFYSTVNQAISKMLLQLPNHFREEMENLLTASAVDEVDFLNNNEQQEIYNTIIKGIRKKLRVRIVISDPGIVPLQFKPVLLHINLWHQQKVGM